MLLPRVHNAPQSARTRGNSIFDTATEGNILYWRQLRGRVGAWTVPPCGGTVRAPHVSLHNVQDGPSGHGTLLTIKNSAKTCCNTVETAYKVTGY